MKMIIFVLLMNMAPAWADTPQGLSDPCQGFDPDDSLRFRDKNYSCKLTWESAEEDQVAMEGILLRKGCQRYEGKGKKTDCFFIRTCPVKNKSEYTRSEVIKLSKEFDLIDESYDPCRMSDEFDEEAGKVILIGSKYQEPLTKYKAWINCKDKKSTEIIMRSPEGKEVKCPVSFL